MAADAASVGLGFLLAPASFVSVQPLVDAASKVEEVVITGSRLSGPSPVPTTVVSRQEILRHQPATALEVLDRLPGVHAFRRGGVGGSSFVSIRGGEPNFTAILIDGLRVNDPTNSQGGAFDFGLINPSALEKIEVASGGSSVVQGADALSGVVHLRLRTPAANEQALHYAGITGTAQQAATATASFGWSNGGVLANVAALAENDRATNSERQQAQLLARIGQQVGSWRFTAMGLHAGVDRKGFPEDSGGPRLAVIQDREDKRSRLSAASLTASFDGPTYMRPQVSAYWTQQASNSRSPAIAPGAFGGVPALVEASQYERVEVQAFVRGGRPEEQLVYAFGAAVARETGSSEGELDLGFPLPTKFRIERQTASLFAEVGLRLQGYLSVSASTRYDDTAALEHWTNRVAFSIRPHERGPSVFGSASGAFKLPSLHALAHPLVGNAGLRPEEGLGWELGIDGELTGVRYRAAIFKTRYTDLIDFDPATFKTVNRNRVDLRGVEVSAAGMFGSTVTWKGVLNYLDYDAPVPLRSRPRWRGSAALTWVPTRRTNAEVRLAYDGDVLDSSVPTGFVIVEGGIRTEASVHWSLAKSAVVRVTAVNFLDGERANVLGFPNSSTKLRLGLELSY